MDTMNAKTNSMQRENPGGCLTLGFSFWLVAQCPHREEFLKNCIAMFGVLQYNVDKGVITMSKTITVRIDDSVKQQAEDTLNEIGLNMSTYINSSLRA